MIQYNKWEKLVNANTKEEIMEKFKMVVTKTKSCNKLPQPKLKAMKKILDSDDYRTIFIKYPKYCVAVLVDNQVYFSPPRENPDRDIVAFINFIYENPDLFRYSNTFLFQGVRFAVLL